MTFRDSRYVVHYVFFVVRFWTPWTNTIGEKKKKNSWFYAMVLNNKIHAINNLIEKKKKKHTVQRTYCSRNDFTCFYLSLKILTSAIFVLGFHTLNLIRGDKFCSCARKSITLLEIVFWHAHVFEFALISLRLGWPSTYHSPTIRCEWV